ncbi:MAG: hypothetical protein IJU76_11680 [Desulfovibrionaceae bacterium]|nr:hypothetical protein [Desulfovibrionaceae bacterium]
MELIEIVKRESKSRDIFVSINNDLSKSITNYDYPLNILYSYALSKKFAASGLFLEGYFSKEDLDIVSKILERFKNLIPQESFAETKEIYEKEAINYLKQYDKNICIDSVKCLIVISYTCKDGKENIKFKNYNNIMNYVNILIPNKKTEIKIARKYKIKRICILLFIIFSLLLINYLTNTKLNTDDFSQKIKIIDS